MSEASDRAKAERYGYVICLLIFLSYVLVFFHRLCPAVIALDIQEAFGASGTLLGVLGSAYFYSYAVMQLPTGLLADSWGPRRTVSAFFVLAALGSALMGAAPSLGMAVFGRVLVGLGVSTVFVCNFKLLAEWFTPRQFSIMGGIFMAMGGVGALSSGTPLAWISNLIGWRMTLVAVGGVTLIMAVLVCGFVRDRPSDMGFPGIRVTGRGSQGIGIGLLEGLKLVVGSYRFWPIAIWASLSPGIAFAFAGLWGGPYLMHVYGLSKAAAGGVLSMFAVALIAGGPFLGWLANRVGRKPVLMGSSLMSIAVCAVFYGFTGALSLPALYALLFCICLGGPASGPVVATVSKELFPVAIAGTSVAMVNLFTFFGAAVFQVLVGAMLSTGAQDGVYSLAGYQRMFLVYLLGALVSLVAAALLKETLSREDPLDTDGKRL